MIPNVKVINYPCDKVICGKEMIISHKWQEIYGGFGIPKAITILRNKLYSKINIQQRIPNKLNFLYIERLKKRVISNSNLLINNIHSFLNVYIPR